MAATGATRPALWGWFAALPSALVFAGLIAGLWTTAAGETITFGWAWAPSLDVSLTFRIDGLSVLFGLLVSGIGAAVALYANAYMAGHPRLPRFFLYLLLFTASMLGVVLSDNILVLFIFWELTTVSSFMLIGFDSEKAESRRNARQSLLVTTAGGLALLAGLILLGQVAGSYSIAEINTSGDVVRDDPLYVPILILVFLGAFSKSAQVPLHFWLPNAMAAPTPVSAFLHSATLVKAGVFLMARLHPSLGGTEVWLWTLLPVGAITAVWASMMALHQRDLKLMLAYTTVMALGALIMFLAVETQVAIEAAMTFVLVHALYKAALFMIVGGIDHATGTRDLMALGGLRRALPMSAAAAALAALSMAGFPPFLGFLGKELKYEGALAIADAPIAMTAASFAANAMMVAVALTVAVRPFWGETTETTKHAHGNHWAIVAAPATLACLGLVLGLAPGLISTFLVGPAVEAVLQGTTPTELKLWHGFTVPLLLSVFTVALGSLLFWRLRAVQAALNALVRRLPTTGDRSYDAIMAALNGVAIWQTKLLQGDRLRRDFLVIFAVATATVATVVAVAPDLSIAPFASVPQWPAIGAVALILVGVAATVITHGRLTGLAGLGAVGVGIALVFLMHGAPDVAITQLLVETLVIVIAAAVLLRLPRTLEVPVRPPSTRGRDALIALLAGATITGVTLMVVDGPLDLSVTQAFEAASVPEAFGRNIVNVILVDFRALDTLGEIAVVVIAGLACLALLRGTGLIPRRRRKMAGAPRP